MPRDLPSLNALRALEAACRLGSFAAAAAELAVTPAAVSQQVRQLEQRLGIALFRRAGRRLEATVEARRLAEDVGAGLDRMAGSIARLRASRDPDRLRVATSPGFASKWLIPRLDRFHREHPRLRVEIAATMAVVDFASEPVDLAIRFGPGRYAGLESELLLRQQVFPVCSPRLLDGERPLRRPEDLRHHQLLHDGSTRAEAVVTDWRLWLTTLGVEGVDPTAGITLSPWTMVIQAAIDGQGVALGRSALLEDDIAAGRLVRPFDVTLPLQNAHWLVYRPDALRQHKVRAFRDWVMQETAAARAEFEACAAV